MRATDIHLREVRCEIERYEYRTPMKFGGRVVTDAELLNVTAIVETADGRQATGTGSMPLGNAWAWPSSQVAGDATLAVMRTLGQHYVARAAQDRQAGHPLEITHRWAADYQSVADQLSQELGLPEPIPKLAQLVAASPLEAAIYDGYGKALAQNAYNLLAPPYLDTDLAHYLNDDFAGEFLDRYTSREPQASLPLYHLVGALDPLTASEVARPVADGLPETLAEWILADGLTHLKIKLAGDDLEWDVQRVADVERVAAEAQERRGCTAWHYSLDFNEKCANVEYVLDFLSRLEEASPAALDRVQYIEQPTHRDLRANPENRMHEAARRKPVVIDESLVDLDSLLLAREQGYSGVALKACKGHTEALLMGAAAQKYNLFLCVQDLTCVGYSFLHSASLAARIPTVAAIEGNGRQYCPAGNQAWAHRYPGMFHIKTGSVATAELIHPGLF